MSVILTPTVAYRPFRSPKSMTTAQEHSIDMYWDIHQVELNDDIKAFHTEGGLATANVSHASNKNMLEKVVSSFTQMDLEVGAAYCQILPFIKNNEWRCWYMTAAAREVTHQRAYAMIVEELGFPDSTWGEFMEYKEMHDKIDLISNTHSRDHSKPLDLAKTIAQIGLGEGIALFGAFACMLNLKRSGLMMGTNLVNEWSLRDEEVHIERNIAAVKDLRTDLSEDENKELDEFIILMVKLFTEAEKRFIDLVFEMGPQEDMTPDDMKQYIMYLADLRLEAFGLPLLYNIEDNPLEWMTWMLSGRKHSNFFEGRITSYDHNGLIGEVDYSKYEEMLLERAL